jgi:hypothetical protein
MKIRKITLFILIIISFLPAKAQLANEIRNYVDSTEVIMNNGRRMVYQTLSNGDYQKAGEVYYYLKEEAAKRHCFAFTLNEELYISLLLTDWLNWLSIARNYTEINKQTSCYQFTEDYVERLYRLTLKNLTTIEAHKKNQNFMTDEVEIIDLFLQLVKSSTPDEPYKARYKLFQRNHSTSAYLEFLTGYMPKPNVKGAFTMSMGPTFVFPSGNLSQVYKPGTLFNITFDLNFGKLYSGFHVEGGLLELKMPIHFTNQTGQVVQQFQPGESFSYVGGGVYAGYFLLRSNRFQIAPYIGLGGYTLESSMYSNDDYDSQEFQIFDSFVFGPGLHTEFKIAEFTLDQYYGYMPGFETSSYISLKLDLGYNIVTKKVNSDFKGNIPYIRMGLIWGFGNF